MKQEEQLEINIETIGVILQNARLKKKKSLADISAVLCIRKMYLAAIEESDFETLPAIPYGLGYVRTYAQYLGIDTEKALELYKQETCTIIPAKENPYTLETKPNKSSRLHIIISIIVILTIYLIWTLSSSSYNDTKITPQEVTNVQQLQQVQENIEEIIPQEEEQIVILEDEYYIEEAESEEQKVEIPVENNKIIVEVLGESWIELKGNNKTYFSGIYNKGDKKEIDFTENLFISVGRPQNIKLLVKGQEKNIVVKNRKMNISIDSL